MSLSNSDLLRQQLRTGPKTPKQLIEKLGFSQPTLSRSVSALADEVLRLGRGRAIQYALRDGARGLGEISVYRVSPEGGIKELGVLIPVAPEGFVMRQMDGVTLHSEGLPWWLFDMQPQGYLGRHYAARYGAALGLQSQLSHWNDTHILQALQTHGHDVTGNLLLGHQARDVFLSTPAPEPIPAEQQAHRYQQLAQEAAQGEWPGSSAGGEQPKFVACVASPDGPRHVLVKFSLTDDNPITARWRDLLLAEHLALHTLRAAGIEAAASRILDWGTQRFLEVQRFDRVGVQGRRGVLSLKALDMEFVGAGNGGWASISHALAQAQVIQPQAAQGAALLQAIGLLIGNTDMHTGNLSFLSDQGRPYSLAPAYDMLPMGLAPSASGHIPNHLPEAPLPPDIAPQQWRHALGVAQDYVQRLRQTPEFSPAFQPGIDAIAQRITSAASKIARLE